MLDNECINQVITDIYYLYFKKEKKGDIVWLLMGYIYLQSLFLTCNANVAVK